MKYVVHSRKLDELSKALGILCRETGYFCYKPIDIVEPTISITWAETLQFIPSECFEDEYCASIALNMFGVVLQIALSEDYVFTIDIDKLRSILKEHPQGISVLR